MPLRIFMLLAGVVICIIYTIRYAEKVKKDPLNSYIYDQKDELKAQFLSNYNSEALPKFTDARKTILIIFILAFVVMLYGLKELSWWFEEMTALFTFVTFIMIFFAKLSEKEFVGEFMADASDLLGVAITIGLAVLSMPIMEPLADVVGINRDIIVSAYQFGQGIMSFITPTGLILASLSMVNVTYDKWLKFVLPLVIIIAILAIVTLGVGVLI